MMSGPQQLFNNPMVTAAAMHYGQDMASRGQAYMEANVRSLLIVIKVMKLCFI